MYLIWNRKNGIERSRARFEAEKEKAALLLQKAQSKIADTASSSVVLAQLQQEFEDLVATMDECFEVKKQLMESKKGDIVKKYERSLLKLRYEQVKLNLENKKQSWKALLSRHA